MDKVIEISQIEDLVKGLKKARQKIVLAGGCFDILHPGHIFFLNEARKQGDTLIIMLEGDESIKKRKGETRPVNTLKKRIEALSRLEMVDYVLPLPLLKTDLEYFDLVKALKPDIIAVTVGDPAVSKKIEQARIVGGNVFEIQHLPEHSTTKLLKKI